LNNFTNKHESVLYIYAIQSPEILITETYTEGINKVCALRCDDYSLAISKFHV